MVYLIIVDLNLLDGCILSMVGRGTEEVRMYINFILPELVAKHKRKTHAIQSKQHVQHSGEKKQKKNNIDTNVL